MGGAVSTLASVDVLKKVNGAVPVYSWTLGSPRVGNPDFASWYQSKSGVKHSQRIVNWHDEGMMFLFIIIVIYYCCYSCFCFCFCFCF